MQGSRLRGALAAMAAFFIWGLFPLFWTLLIDVPPLQVLAHRALWCAVAVWFWLLVRGEVGWVRQVGLRLLALLALGGVLISINWAVYVVAVVTGHVIDTSLGYFISPLVSFVIAVAVLRERLNWSQRLAVAIATSGVVLLGLHFGAPPWIALALALSFGSYGLVRKLAPFNPVRSLAVESGVMLLPAAAYLLWCRASGTNVFLHGHWGDDLLLIAGGPITAVPLVLFAYGAQRVSMMALGVMQYIAPTVALLLGILVFHEPFGGARLLAFGCIWVALAIFTGEMLRRYWSPGRGAAG
ncbi:MAG: EamA family transporter RarD [Pseudomonadota bacterium]